VVAKGVEEKRVVELLKGLGCDVGQGYFFAKRHHSPTCPSGWGRPGPTG
jgi:EAL domain-containing protein (putative c-di-GMP-specific phosphodiesterase class I)